QCPPFRGNEGILLQNMVPNIPEFRTWLPAISIAAKVSVNGVPGQTMFFLDTLTMDAEAMQADVLWRGVTPLPANVNVVALEALLGGTFEQPEGVQTAAPDPGVGAPIVFAR